MQRKNVGQRKTPSNKVASVKHSSFKDSGKKRNSATPVSPKNRGLANSRSATAQNLYQLSNIKGSVVQKNLNLYEQAKYASLKSSKSGKL